MNSIKTILIAGMALLAIACSKVTEDSYQKVEPGMTMEQVQNLLGKADLSESTNLAGISTTRAEWHGKDGTISIRFIESKVRAKNWQPPES